VGGVPVAERLKPMGFKERNEARRALEPKARGSGATVGQKKKI